MGVSLCHLRSEDWCYHRSNMTVMLSRSPAQTNGGGPVKGERKRVMPPPLSTVTPFKKPKIEETLKPEFEDKVVDQACQTLPPTSTPTAAGHCKHSDYQEDVCPIGTPVILPATVWYEDRDGLLVVNVTWRGRTYVGTLMDSTKSEHIAQRYSSGNIRQTNSQGSQSSQSRVTEEIAEEEESSPEKTLRERKTNKSKVKREKSREKDVDKKMYRCDKCDKDYKYPSGLSYHNKHTHEKITIERESV